MRANELFIALVKFEPAYFDDCFLGKSRGEITDLYIIYLFATSVTIQM